jgi:hypothetical protein
MEFPIFPIEKSLAWILLPIAVFIVVLCLSIVILFGFIIYSSGNAGFILETDGIKIKASLYSRTIPYNIIKKDEIKIINLNENYEFKIGFRSNGIGLPGYLEGWFKMQNGRKALLFVTKKENVVYIPTTKDYNVLLSPIKPEEFINQLKQSVPGM